MKWSRGHGRTSSPEGETREPTGSTARTPPVSSSGAPSTSGSPTMLKYRALSLCRIGAAAVDWEAYQAVVCADTSYDGDK
jgi:hypothetical protein